MQYIRMLLIAQRQSLSNILKIHHLRKRQLALSTYNLKPLKTSADPSIEVLLLGMRNVPLVPFFVFLRTCGGDFFEQGVNAWGG